MCGIDLSTWEDLYHYYGHDYYYQAIDSYFQTHAGISKKYAGVGGDPTQRCQFQIVPKQLTGQV
jgi:hypothetical protein